ncbi:MAG: hypothetical protein JWN00_573 [Actinomycetia bacterium]|nr:hypothetical protein [Actinomycetes bacterium]
MAAKTTNGSNPEKATAEPVADHEVDEEYEDDLVELVERLVKRRSSRRAAKPTSGEGSDAAETVVDPISMAPAVPAAPLQAAARAAAMDPAGNTVRMLVMVSAVLAAALAAVSTFAFLQWRGNQSGSERLQVAQRAGEIVSAVYSYDYKDSAGHLRALEKVLTKDAAAVVKSNWSVLSKVVEAGQYVSSTQIQQVYVGDISGGKATVMVTVSTKLATSKGYLITTGAIEQFTLVRLAGTWLASGVPVVVSQGTETAADLKGNPIADSSPSASPSAAATATPSPTPSG